MGVANCGSGEKLESLCILNIPDKMCWVDKEAGEGFTFEQIRKLLDDHNMATFCVREDDYKRVTDRLRDCKYQSTSTAQQLIESSFRPVR
jgi:hypothetical protein